MTLQDYIIKNNLYGKDRKSIKNSLKKFFNCNKCINNKTCESPCFNLIIKDIEKGGQYYETI